FAVSARSRTFVDRLRQTGYARTDAAPGPAATGPGRPRQPAGVAEPADAQDLGSCGATRGSSTLPARTSACQGPNRPGPCVVYAWYNGPVFGGSGFATPPRSREEAMKATLDKVENNTAYLTVEVPAAMAEEALERAFRRLSRNILIPGFRRGSAPRALVERRIGSQALLDEALDDLLPEAYAQAVRETGIEPIDRPTVTDIHYEEGQPLSFKAQVEVKPEVTLGDYRSIRVERPQVQVDEADVNNLLERLREAQAQLVPVDDEAEAAEGHVAVIDFKGTVDGQPFPGGEGQDYMVEIGAGRLVEGFEQQLIGMRVGQERDIDVTFPEDHPEVGLAGKAARFHVTLKELKRKELPALDDEFARSVGEFQTLEELRADVEKNLRRRAEEDAQEQ